MYRVGFGDCFLLSLPTSGAERQHILIDCGVKAQGDIGTLAGVVADIASVTSRKLAVVIATHAHEDHISGFGKFGQEFAKFQIGEVWLPWTWDLSNPVAAAMQTKHAALAAALSAHFQRLGPAASRSPLTSAAADAVSNLKGNDLAISRLKSGFGTAARVRFLKARDNLIDPAGIAGLAVDVLGPPESEAFLGQMDPPASQHYLQAAGALAADGGQGDLFPRHWRVRRQMLERLGLATADEEGLAEATTSAAEALAFVLDNARNNESVVTLLTYRGQRLLFAGDAQYGNWRWWLENEKPDQILPPVRFLKVAHHGSVNATPKGALEKMTDGRFAAMVSTQSKPWPSIPRVPLMKRLSEKTAQKVVRSDWLAVAGAPLPSAGTEPSQPANLPAGFTEGPLWFDYVLTP